MTPPLWQKGEEPDPLSLSSRGSLYIKKNNKKKKVKEESGKVGLKQNI